MLLDQLFKFDKIPTVERLKRQTEVYGETLIPLQICPLSLYRNTYLGVDYTIPDQ